MSTETIARQELATVFKLIHKFGWDDLIYTHATIRISGTDTFLINDYRLMFNEITAENLVKVNLQGEVIGNGVINPAGYIIHSAIHEDKPKVRCVIHLHTQAGTAVSTDSRGLWPISQKALLVLNSLSYHDYQGIVVDANEKVLLQKNLGNNRAMILRNHGLLTVGDTVAEAFLTMRTLQLACEIQIACDYDSSIKLDTNIQKKISSQFDQRSLDFSWQALVRQVS